jgi:hypothetical protein
MNKHEEFKRIYKKFVDGTRWLNKGTATQQDKEELTQLVIEPMDAMWMTFTDEEKAYWDKVRRTVDLFNGTIVLEDQAQKQQVHVDKKKRKKRWRSYSQPY